MDKDQEISVLQEQFKANTQYYQAQLESKSIIIEKQNDTIDKLDQELQYLRRQLYGAKSERYISRTPEDLAEGFKGEKQLPVEAELEALPKPVKPKTPSKDIAKPVRLALDQSLERVDVILEPLEVLQGATSMGQEVTEVLTFEPGRYYVTRYIRPKYVSSQNDQSKVFIADLPSLPMPKGNAGASVLAHLLVGKYQDHLPFHRQINIAKRVGVHFSKSTLNGWFQGSVDLLEPLYLLLVKLIMKNDYLQIDETTIPVMDSEKKGATAKGYHWIIRDPIQNLLYFHYDHGSRAKYVAANILKNFKGALQSDAYTAYDDYENKEGVLLIGCWAHARRYFETALANDAKRAFYAMEQIQMLYALEKGYQQEKLTFQQIKDRRQKEAYPILIKFEEWLNDQIPNVLPSQAIGKAINYTLRIYPRLARYVLDGRYKIDNNLAENGVRPLALGRKNYLFCGNHEAAYRTAIIYSLMGSCKINNVNPMLWLQDVLNRIQDCSMLKLHELLPNNWKQNN